MPSDFCKILYVVDQKTSENEIRSYIHDAMAKAGPRLNTILGYLGTLDDTTFFLFKQRSISFIIEPKVWSLGMNFKNLALGLALIVSFGCSPNQGTPLNPPVEVEVPTLPLDSTEISFFSFGDWGTGTPQQIAVASALKDYCQSHSCDFGLLLGDNFYESGVDSVNDAQWKDKFELVYTLDLPFYVALGNHDHQGNIQAQMDYSNLQNRWKLPAEQYRISIPESSQKILLEIFVIDSTGLNQGQINILKTWIENSTARWKILAMHHPIYSNGNHGDDSAQTNDKLLPIICHSIDLVLSGHDHLFSHLTDGVQGDDGCTFDQFVVGTGGRTLHQGQNHLGALFSQSAFGFLHISAGPTQLRVAFIGSDGVVAYVSEF